MGAEHTLEFNLPPQIFDTIDMMNEHINHSENPDPDDDKSSQDAPATATESGENIFETVSSDIKASAIVVVARKSMGATISAKIISEYLKEVHPGRAFSITPNTGFMRERGRGNTHSDLKAHFGKALAKISPDEQEKLLDEAKQFVLKKALAFSPSVVWFDMPHARQLVVDMLMRKPVPKPSTIALALSTYLRDRCGLPLERNLPEAAFRTAIKKNGGEEAYAGILSSKTASGSELVPGADGPLMRSDDIDRLIAQADSMKHVQSPVWRDTKVRLFIGALLQDESISVEAIQWAIGKFTKFTISVPGIGYRIYSHDEGRLGLARSLLSDTVLPEVQREIRTLVRAAKIGCRAYSIETAIMRHAGIAEPLEESTIQRLRAYFIKNNKTPLEVGEILRFAHPNILPQKAVSKWDDHQ